MMKLLILSVLFLLCSTRLFSQTPDTVFLVNTRTSTFYDMLYIDPHPSAEVYRQVGDFSRTEDANEYPGGNDTPLKKWKIDLSEKWVPLVIYKGKYFVELNGWACCKTRILDSVVMVSHMEVDVGVISGYHRINRNKFEFDLSFEYRPNWKLLVHLIDPGQGIAVFEERWDNLVNFRLMVQANRIRNFPVIVGKSSEVTAPYRGYDVPNYDSLFRSAKH